MARSSGVHARGTARTDGEREREMFLASAALSRWLPVDRCGRLGEALGAALSGDLDRAELGLEHPRHQVQQSVELVEERLHWPCDEVSLDL